MNTFKTLTKQNKSIRTFFGFVHTTQHVSGIRIFLEIKLCARARNVPILDGLDFIKLAGVAAC